MTIRVERPQLRARIVRALSRNHVTALARPRQVDKTTLARSILAPDRPACFDLENPLSLARPA